MQPLSGGKLWQVFFNQEQVRAGAYHKGKGAFPLVVKVDDHSGRAVLIVEIHMADVDLLLLQGMTHVAAKRVTADAADKSAVAAKAGNPYRHVSRRASRALQQAPFALRQQVHHRVAQNPNFCIHAKTLQS
ncbi:hypothetical protein PrNR1418_39970 (plasmid) [Providencia rettgeri]|nr:hypothetical protein PrNR1418_39970 [Providencia rettgeri]